MDGKRYHFVGVGGVGMSGIAKVMLEQGYKVSGSDIKDSARLQCLRDLGAMIFVGHTPEHIDAADVVVVSSAISIKNPEVHSAIRRAIPIYHRSEMLARIMRQGKGIGVAGTHGKTTTTAMVALMLQRCGLDPTAVVGGDVEELGSTNARLGGGEFIVAEADESDGSLIRLCPHIAVVTNIEADHLDYYPDIESIVDTFRTYIEHLPSDGFAVCCLDDPNIQKLVGSVNSKFVTYGLGDNARFRAVDIDFDRLGARFTVLDNGRKLGDMELNVPGKHNVTNALAAIGVGLNLGLSFKSVSEALVDFRGVKRRFQIVGKTDRVMIVDDYAHHPTEIRATLSAARATDSRRLISIFQPHRYTRTKFFYDQYGRAFFNADEVIVMDVYSAGERPIPNVNGRLVANSLKKNGHRKVRYIPESEDVLKYLERHVKTNDVVITLGAGDVWKIAYGLSERVGGLALARAAS